MNQEAKISELTPLPGNLSLAALLAIVQGGVTYHATGEQVSDMVHGAISVVRNSDGVSLRFPAIGIQIASGRSEEVTASSATGSNFRSSEITITFPQPFAAGTTPIVTLGATYNYSTGSFNPPWAAAGATPTTNVLTRAFFVASVTGISGRVTYLAWGEY